MRDYGIDLAAEGHNATVVRVRRSAIAGEIAAALTNWSIVRRRRGVPQQPSARELMVLAKDIDDEVWRNRLRDAFMPPGISNEELAALIERAPLETFSATTLFLVIQAAANKRLEGAGVEDALRGAQRRFAGDFWINFALARYFESANPPRLEEAVRYYTAALAIRPRTAAVHSNLGTALHRQGRRAEAMAEYRRAIASEPEFAAAYSNLGFALCEEKQFAEAEDVVRRGLAIRNNWAEAHYSLGSALLGQREFEAAAKSFQRAVELKPGFELAAAGLETCSQQAAANGSSGR
jgi:superkiller protein 3